ncbi:MAG: type II toxin-antitoxin system RelE/ParE family toxin [Desulfococcaceae bacterium]
MTPVIFDPEARAEFLEAVRYYESQKPGLGFRFRNMTEEGIKKVAENPFLFRVIQPPFRRYLLHIFPYSIIYSIEPDHLRIIAVSHNKRKPGYWWDRAT